MAVTPVRSPATVRRVTPATRAATPPVLVFGTGLTALGVLRVYGRRGIPTLATGAGDACLRRSRWYRAAPIQAPRGPSPEALAEFLSGAAVDEAVLVACEDNWARCLAAAAPMLGERFHTSLPDATVLAMLLDKWGLAGALGRSEVPHPTTRLIDRADDLDAVPEEMLAAAFLKPTDSQRFYSTFGVKAFAVRSLHDAHAKFERARAAGISMLLQEYVPGSASSHYFIDGFVDARGAVRAIFARRRHRMYPPDFGNSSYMVSVPLDEVQPARIALERLLRDVGYRGIFSAEFKRDARDGVLRLLEVNVRPWWYVEFTARCGVDVCWLAYEDALGRPVESIERYAVGESLVYTYYDLFACRSAWRAGDLSLRHWFGQWMKAQRPLFCFDDPWPGTVQGTEFVLQHVAKLVRQPFRRR